MRKEENIRDEKQHQHSLLLGLVRKGSDDDDKLKMFYQYVIFKRTTVDLFYSMIILNAYRKISKGKTKGQKL